MSKNILIFGSGSIGNHMAYASRRLNLNTSITDIDPSALLRMKYKIFPKRYGKWDDNINIIDYKSVFQIKKKYDLIVIGTPPKTHLDLFFKCKKSLKYKKILIEKPLCAFKEIKLDKFKKIIKKNSDIYCGYNHSISKSFLYFENLLYKKKFKLKKIDVGWCEDWRGILNAHFWLKDEFKSYLGNSADGGGALQEHSHGLHLLYLILKRYKINLDKENFLSSSLNKKKNNKVYDLLTSVHGINRNISFNYLTDLKSNPENKSIKVSDGKNEIHLYFNYKKNTDTVMVFKNKILIKKKNFIKTRSSEFENELQIILSLENARKNLFIKNAINVMHIIKKIKRNEKKQIV